METIIHIGQHKTGTTSLQNYLQQNNSDLKTQRIFVTDKILEFKNPSHFILNVYALSTNRYSSMKENILKSRGKDFLKELDKNLPDEIKKIYDKATQENCNKIIWSNEGLYLLNSIEEYVKLVNLFSPFSSKISVICCFRDTKSYEKSFRKQLKKQNIDPSNEPDSYRYLEEDSWLFDYERKKRILSEVFEECLYYDYSQEDNIKPFLELLNIQLLSPTSLRMNVTKEDS